MQPNVQKILFIAILVLILLIVLYLKQKMQPIIIKIGGFSILTVDSGSMMPEIEIGEAILIKESKNYKEGDIVTYNVKEKYLVTHRIHQKTTKGYILKGDNNNVVDNEIVQEKQIEGKVIFHAKWLGFIIRYYLLFLLLIILSLIIIL